MRIGSSADVGFSEQEIGNFWQSSPCGETFVGGAPAKTEDSIAEFFSAYDHFRYTKEKHILKCLDGIKVQGRKVLEIGLGQGADAEQLIRRGAVWSGLDLTKEAVDRTRMRLTMRKLPYQSVTQASALAIPFADS